MEEHDYSLSVADTIDTIDSIISESTNDCDETIEMETFSNHNQNENEESGPTVNDNVEERQASSTMQCHNHNQNENEESGPTVNDNIEERQASSTMQRHNMQEKLCKFLTLHIVILVVVGVMQIPITLYYTNQSSNNFSISGIIDLENCSVNLGSMQDNMSDLLLDMCQSENINLFENCLAPEATAISTVYNIAERKSSCTRNGLQFFCEAISFLCDGSTNISSTLSKECVQTRDNRCAGEWRIVENFLNLSLPDCSSFDEGANLTVSNIPVLPCPDTFGVFCGSLCFPLCGEPVLAEDLADVYNVMMILLYVINLTGGVITLIASIIKRKTMFKYPIVYILYGAVVAHINVLFIALPVIVGPSKLMCSHDNFIVASNSRESTVFCRLQGFVVVSTVQTFFLLWMFHVVHVFSSLAFPFKYQRWVKSHTFKRQAYVAEIILILICGVLPGVIVMFTDGYTTFGFPPLCAPASVQFMFYVVLLPLTVGSAFGLSVLFAAFWILRKKYKKEEEQRTTGFSLKFFTRFSVAEIKLLILFFYYWITTVLITNSFSFLLRTSNGTLQDLFDFINCSIGGYRTECVPLEQKIQEGDTIGVTLLLISHTSLSFVSWVNLFFVIQFSDLKTFVNKLFKKCNII